MNLDSFLNSKMNQELIIRENSRIVPTLVIVRYPDPELE